MAKKSKPNDLKGSGVKSTGDPQTAHEEDMKEPEALNDPNDDPDDPDAAFVDDSETQHSSEANEENEESVLVRCLTDRQPINGHMLRGGAVTKMKPSDIRNHRDRGVSLEDVVGEYDEDAFVDTSEPYVAEEKKESA